MRSRHQKTLFALRSTSGIVADSFREYRTLVPYAYRYRWHYFFGVLCLIVTSGGQLVIPQFVRRAIDIMVEGGFAVAEVGRLMLALAGLAVVIGLGRFGWRYFIHGASRRIEAELRGRLFEHLLLLSPRYYAGAKTGDIMARATNDMNAIRMATGIALVAFIDGVFMTLAILVILFSSNARLAAITIIPLPFITVMIIFAGRVVTRLFREVQEGFSHLSERTQESIAGIRVIKSFVKEPHFLKRFEDVNLDYRRKNLNYIRVWGLFFPFVAFLSGLTTLLLLRFGGEQVIAGAISPGDFVATMSYLAMLAWPMLGAGFTVNVLARGAASLARINAILKEPPQIVSMVGAHQKVSSIDLSIRNLTVVHPDAGEPALDGVSIDLPQGTMLGILGRTGSGKSTLIRTLPRLIDPPENTVFVGGVDVRDYDLGVLRSLFGIVPQDTFLFSATIRENIGFAVDELSDEELTRVADISTISRDIGVLSEGYQTVVGERGVTLSGGQKQRVAISRALAKNPDILILDDALSAVDTESEERILKAILAFRKGKSTILISHRISALQHADLCIVMDHGRIAQRGNHAELLAQGGLYREIYDLQQIERKHARGHDG
ncbi:MAG: ABC transporter ATP-binding protein [Spirochaetaceae bacterium]|nr:MAG: ABC transporter ATP-binding protein [Spirochaetaceae bacterium]